MLAEAMGVSEATEGSEADATPTAAVTPAMRIADPRLPARYAAFYQVIVTRQGWSRAEIADVAKKHGLMLSGAIEAINEWATERHGGPLVYEDDQQVMLEQAYLQ
jgi:hypothetical protein